MIGERISSSSYRHIRYFVWFNTKSGIEAVICEERRNSSYFRTKRVRGEFGKRKPVYLIVLKVGYVGSKELF
jgi:hypothetical protein